MAAGPGTAPGSTAAGKCFLNRPVTTLVKVMPAALEADIQVGQPPAVVLSVRQSPTATRAQGCLIPWSQLHAAQLVEREEQQTHGEGLSAFKASIPQHSRCSRTFIQNRRSL